MEPIDWQIEQFVKGTDETDLACVGGLNREKKLKLVSGMRLLKLPKISGYAIIYLNKVVDIYNKFV